MTIVPKPFWPLAEHIAFGQNAFDGSIGSGVIFCIKHILPGALDFFNSLPFQRLLGSYRNCRCMFFPTSQYDFPVGFELYWPLTPASSCTRHCKCRIGPFSDQLTFKFG